MKNWRKLPECTMNDLIYQENQLNLSHTALNYFGKKISYKLFFEKVNEFAKAFQACGIKKEDVVTIMSLHTPETIYSILMEQYLWDLLHALFYRELQSDDHDRLRLYSFGVIPNCFLKAV